MPIYEFECQACKKSIEIIQKINDAPPTKCEHCGQENQMTKKIASAGFRLSGSGWYETDFKTGKKKNLADKSSDSSK